MIASSVGGWYSVTTARAIEKGKKMDKFTNEITVHLYDPWSDESKFIEVTETNNSVTLAPDDNETVIYRFFCHHKCKYINSYPTHKLDEAEILALV